MSRLKLRVVHPNAHFATSSASSRPCYRFVKNDNESAENRFAAKIGGLPFRPDNRPWPVCLSCGAPLSFIFQFPGHAIPELFGNTQRMLSLFYCFECSPWWNIENKGVHLEWLPYSPDTRQLPEKFAPLGIVEVPYPCAINIEAWEDFPSIFEEIDENDGPGPEADDAASLTFPGSKLGGFPAWRARGEIPICPDCSRPMRFIGQLASGEFHGLRFGDNGRFFLFECWADCGRLSFVMQPE